MSREHTGAAALSYFELAVMLGHTDPKVNAAARLEWNDLLRSAEKIVAAIKAKANEEKAAKAAPETAREAESDAA